MKLLRWLDSWLHGQTRMEFSSDDVVDVWSFRAAERLKVHEARTEADRVSSGRPPLKLPPARRRRLTMVRTRSGSGWSR